MNYNLIFALSRSFTIIFNLEHPSQLSKIIEYRYSKIIEYRYNFRFLCKFNNRFSPDTSLKQIKRIGFV